METKVKSAMSIYKLSLEVDLQIEEQFDKARMLINKIRAKIESNEELGIDLDYEAFIVFLNCTIGDLNKLVSWIAESKKNINRNEGSRGDVFFAMKENYSAQKIMRDISQIEEVATKCKKLAEYLQSHLDLGGLNCPSIEEGLLEFGILELKK